MDWGTGSVRTLFLLIDIFVDVDQNDYIFILVFGKLDVLILCISVAHPSGFLWCVGVCVCARGHACLSTSD